MTLEHGNDLLSVAGRVCTAKQIEVIKLHEAGLGWKRIALILGVSPDTVRSHHRAAVHKILKEVERVEAAGGSAAGQAGEGARASGRDGATRGGGIGHAPED
jgi:uncharacterized protein YjcR